jgi:hypothetical protein
MRTWTNLTVTSSKTSSLLKVSLLDMPSIHQHGRLIYNHATHRLNRTRIVIFDEEWKLATTTQAPIITSTKDDDYTDEEDASSQGGHQHVTPPPGEKQQALPPPGEQQPPIDKTMRRASQTEGALLKKTNHP